MELITPNSSNSSNNNFVSRSYKTGTATAKSVLEKLKTLGSSDSTSPSITSTSEPTSALSIFWNILLFLIAFLILGFIIINILASMKMLSPNLEAFFKPILILLDYNFKPDTTVDATILNTAIDTTASDSAASYAANSQAVADKAANDVKGVPVDANNLTAQLPSTQSVAQLFTTENTVPAPAPAPEPAPEPNESSSSKSNSKSGYCYVGTDRGFRSCVKVDDYDTCMSGDIFPTLDICINPRLRP